MTDWIDASFRLDSAYGTQLSTTPIHLTPCVFPTPWGRKPGILYNVLTKKLKTSLDKDTEISEGKMQHSGNLWTLGGSVSQPHCYSISGI